MALHLAAKRPESVRSIITIGCGGVADPAGADDFEPESLIRNNQTEFIERMKTLHFEAHCGDWQHYMRQSTRDWRMYPNLAEEDWKKLTMPMLLIGGETDQFASPRRLSAMKKKCPQAVIWSVIGGSHRPHMPSEQVKEVNTWMLDFLKTV